MSYAEGSWHRPYQAAGGQEGLGFGNGDGSVSGELSGKLTWANFPRRREDGVWTPNLRGVVRTADGDDILISIHGQSVEEASSDRRAILARIELTTEVERFRWLNTCFVVGEGEIDEGHEGWWLDIYVCVNEVAHSAPAIGQQPPERYRQRGQAAD